MDLSEAGSQAASPTSFIQDEALPLTGQTSEEREEEGGFASEIAAALKLRKDRKEDNQEKPKKWSFKKKSQEDKGGDSRTESVSSQGGMGMQGKSGLYMYRMEVVFVCAHNVRLVLFCFNLPPTV